MSTSVTWVLLLTRSSSVLYGEPLQATIAYVTGGVTHTYEIFVGSKARTI